MKNHFTFVSFCLVAILTSTMALAGQKTLLVSVDKAHVKPSEVQNAIQSLNFKDHNTGICWVDSEVSEYIPYTDAPYYGVAIVEFQWNCDRYAQVFLDNLQRTQHYTFWSNPRIEPTPAISGGN